MWCIAASEIAVGYYCFSIVAGGGLLFRPILLVAVIRCRWIGRSSGLFGPTWLRKVCIKRKASALPDAVP